jgi:hypothetical protein
LIEVSVLIDEAIKTMAAEGPRSLKLVEKGTGSARASQIAEFWDRAFLAE